MSGSTSETPWPTAEEAARSRLFSPLMLRPSCVLNARTWVPAMVPWRATEDGLVTDDLLRWYGRMSDGRPGAIVIEATGVRDVPSGPLLRIGHDRYVPGLARLVDVVRARSDGQTKVFLQLIDFLAVKRRPSICRYLGEFLKLTPAHAHALARELGRPELLEASGGELRDALAALPAHALERVLSPREREELRVGYRERITDLHLPHVRDLPARLPGVFAAATRRAKAAGFDGVELHAAHAYTLASFLSAANDRPDGYGGDLEGRLRLPREVLTAVRSEAGADFVVGVRYLGEEAIAGGYGVDDAAFFGVAFANAGADFLSLSRGGKFEDARQPAIGQAVYPYTGPSGAECMPTTRVHGPDAVGWQLHQSRAVRAALRAAGLHTPVVAAGGLHTFAAAEGALQDGDADLIAAARQTLADPDWWTKLRLGRGAEIRCCERTNYCEGLDQKHKMVTCRLWDRLPIADDDDAGAQGGRRLIAPPWRPPGAG